MLQTVLIILVFFIPFGISLFTSLKISINGSDNSYHLLMIKAIKNNKNSFISTMPYFIDKNRHAYPQFIHWIFSYFKDENILKYAKYTGVIGHLLSSLLLLWFSDFLFFNFIENSSLDHFQFMCFIGILYSFLPIHYDILNAKNVGFSARGFGLFLGQALTYCMILYLATDSICLLLIAGFIAYVILISSIFSIQFLIFFSLLSSIVFFDIYLFIPLILGLFIFFIFHKKIANTFFKGQFVHKKLYYLHLAKIFILKQRYSIWRDFIYDFWIKLKKTLKKEESIFGFIQYVITNPVINLFLGIPFVLLFLITSPNSTLILIIIYKVILVTFLLFLLISFRKTRFLGEPERYVEFSIGLIAIYLAVFFDFQSVPFLVLLGLSITFIFLRIILVKKKMSNDSVNLSKDLTSGSLSRGVHFNKVIADLKIRHDDFKDTKVLSNVSEISKLLLSTDYKVFRHSLFQEKVGKFHFTDLYQESYFMIKLPIILEIIKEYQIDFLFYAKNNEDDALSVSMLDRLDNKTVIYEDEIMVALKFHFK